VISEFSTVVITKKTVFLNVPSCSLLDTHKPFGRTCPLPSYALKTAAIDSSKIFLNILQTTWCHITGGSNPYLRIFHIVNIKMFLAVNSVLKKCGSID
jgi:hypothetical protein